MDPLWLASSKLRRGRLAECIKICDEILSENPQDQAAWFLKCKATVKEKYIDDIEFDEEGVAEMIMDENAVASVPRPGTSLQNPLGKATSSTSGMQADQSVRPMSQAGRPVTGFARPNSSRPMSGAGSDSVRTALQSSRRSGTASSRPMTTLGREVRLGTAALNGGNGALLDAGKLNVKKYAGKTGLAMAIVEYLLHVEHNNRKALELCAEATVSLNYNDWFWKARLGKCYYRLGMFRDAERQFRSSIASQPVINTYLELVNVYIRLDVPNSALDTLKEASERFPVEPRLLLGIARIHEMLLDSESCVTYYRSALALDSSQIEGIASLGAHYFYHDQPEMALRYYRRLLQMGITNSAELWNNIGLCCFYSSQYDMALTCFDRALRYGDDDELADVWYNIGHIGIALGDLGLAYQAFKVALSIDPSHGEALNNISVLEIRRQKADPARSGFIQSGEMCNYLFEPLYNASLLAYRMGEVQEAYSYIEKSLRVYPHNADGKELQESLQKLLLNV